MQAVYKKFKIIILDRYIEKQLFINFTKQVFFFCIIQEKYLFLRKLNAIMLIILLNLSGVFPSFITKAV
jgi:hypothetical protein